MAKVNKEASEDVGKNRKISAIYNSGYTGSSKYARLYQVENKALMEFSIMA
jgi:hypothetical protein